MLYYERIDVSQGIGINKTNELLKCNIIIIIVIIVVIIIIIIIIIIIFILSFLSKNKDFPQDYAMVVMIYCKKL